MSGMEGPGHVLFNAADTLYRYQHSACRQTQYIQARGPSYPTECPESKRGTGSAD